MGIGVRMESVIKKDLKIWNKDFIVLISVSMFAFINLVMILTSIAKYVTFLGGNEMQAGLIAGVFSITSLVTRPLAGNLIDRFNKKLIYASALIIVAIATFCYSITTDIKVIILIRLIHGFGWAFIATVGLTMASNTAPEEKLSQTIGIYGLSIVVAMAIAPNIALYITTHFGYNFMFITSSFLTVCAMIMLIFVKQPPKILETADNNSIIKPKFSLGKIISIKALTPMLILVFSGMAYSSMTTFVNAYGYDYRGIENPGVFFTAYAIMLLLVRPLSGKLADIKGEKYIIFPGTIAFISSLIVISQATSVFGFIIAGLLTGVGYGAIYPTMMSLAFKRVPSHQRGIASSTTSMGIDIGIGGGAAIAGKLVSTVGYSIMFLLFIVAIIISCIIFIIDQSKKDKSSTL